MRKRINPREKIPAYLRAYRQTKKRKLEYNKDIKEFPRIEDSHLDNKN